MSFRFFEAFDKIKVPEKLGNGPVYHFLFE